MASQWRKSSYSAIGDCVAIRRLDAGTIGIRNTNDPDGPVLAVTPAAWAAWLERIKAGAYDALACHTPAVACS